MTSTYIIYCEKVYGIGGINEENIDLVRNSGVSGVCIMSGIMQCDDVGAYLGNLTETSRSINCKIC